MPVLLRIVLEKISLVFTLIIITEGHGNLKRTALSHCGSTAGEESGTVSAGWDIRPIRFIRCHSSYSFTLPKFAVIQVIRFLH
jgi:hypothetical protein